VRAPQRRSLAHFAGGVAQLRQRLRCPLGVAPALGRQRDASAGPLEEHDAELRLELLDMRAHHRLRTMQPRRRAREAAALGDREEALEPAQVHVGPIVRSIGLDDRSIRSSRWLKECHRAEMA
jgi:hypothetical protein